jgi:hypothetical protein
MAHGRARDERTERQWRLRIDQWRASGLSVRGVVSAPVILTNYCDPAVIRLSVTDGVVPYWPAPDPDRARPDWCCQSITEVRIPVTPGRPRCAPGRRSCRP